MAKDKGKGLSGMFNDINMDGVAKFLLKTVLLGAVFFLAGGIIDFTFFHDHPLGEWMIGLFRDTLLPIYDSVALMAGMPEYTIAAAEQASVTFGGAEAAAGTAAAAEATTCVPTVDAFGIPDPASCAPP